MADIWLNKEDEDISFWERGTGDLLYTAPASKLLASDQMLEALKAVQEELPKIVDQRVPGNWGIAAACLEWVDAALASAQPEPKKFSYPRNLVKSPAEPEEASNG